MSRSSGPERIRSCRSSRNQTIHAYTDLLLHDMGDGLADGRPAFAATGQRMANAAAVGARPDRARSTATRSCSTTAARATSTEAILWHGGEASASRERFRAMPAQDRAALLAFLNSL